MAQGKLKVKAKPPPTNKTKVNRNKKGLSVQRRGNAPVAPKKARFEEAHKLKKIITKTVNKAMENDLRDRALNGKKSLTKKEPPKAPKAPAPKSASASRKKKK